MFSCLLYHFMAESATGCSILIVSSSYGDISGDEIEERLHSAERLTDKKDAVNLTPNGALMFKEAPIVIDFEHLICLFLSVVTIPGIAILTEASIRMFIYPDSDIIAIDAASILLEDDQHGHLTQSVFALRNRITTQSF